jgi:hypothetical protein
MGRRMTFEPLANDRRAEPRRRVLRSGKLTFSPAFSLDCPIRDETEAGARIRTGGTPLPRTVVLVSVAKRVAHEAEVIWQRGDDAGVRFAARHELDCGPPPRSGPLRHAQALWSYSKGQSQFIL